MELLCNPTQQLALQHIQLKIPVHRPGTVHVGLFQTFELQYNISFVGVQIYDIVRYISSSTFIWKATMSNCSRLIRIAKLFLKNNDIFRFWSRKAWENDERNPLAWGISTVQIICLTWEKTKSSSSWWQTSEWTTLCFNFLPYPVPQSFYQFGEWIMYVCHGLQTGLPFQSCGLLRGNFLHEFLIIAVENKATRLLRELMFWDCASTSRTFLLLMQISGGCHGRTVERATKKTT